MQHEAMMTVASVGVLLFVILIQSTQGTLTNGVAHALSNREGGKGADGLEGRIERTRVNTIENLAMFVPLVLLALVTEHTNTWTSYGATVFVAARAVYALAYIAGVTGLRSAAWMAGLGGTLAVAFGLFA